MAGFANWIRNKKNSQYLVLLLFVVLFTGDDPVFAPDVPGTGSVFPLFSSISFSFSL